MSLDEKTSEKTKVEPLMWANVQQIAKQQGRPAILILLLTTLKHSVGEKLTIMPKVLEATVPDLAKVTAVIASGDTIEDAMKSAGAAQGDVAYVIVSPHAEMREGLPKELWDRWGAVAPNISEFDKTYFAVSVRHSAQCGKKQGESCEHCRQMILMKQMEL